jgi:hypothetical protein
MSDRFPGYDVLSKHDGMSWNDATRRAIDARLAIRDEPVFFAHEEWLTLRAVCDRILPQPQMRDKVPLAAMIDRRMLKHGDTGTKYPPMPYDGPCWKQGLQALEAEAQGAHGMSFHQLSPTQADALLTRCQNGALKDKAWGEIPPKMFFDQRILSDVPAAYYSHPTAWNEIGFGGPASPRGYVRMQADMHDPWEATEAKPGQYEKALKRNRNVR